MEPNQLFELRLRDALEFVPLEFLLEDVELVGGDLVKGQSQEVDQGGLA